jgi:hypothetical protein
MVWTLSDCQYVAGRSRMGDFPIDPGDHHSRLSAASFVASQGIKPGANKTSFTIRRLDYASARRDGFSGNYRKEECDRS